jgi:NAD(P)-dependent dehydrogenase (short-subunit alcohol dehydrogenase family)
MEFQGKVAFVTGAGSGIGRASAKAFGARGAVVLIADINLEAAEETAHAISQAGGEAHAYSLDVTDVRAIADLIASLSARFGRIDMAHNNAGIEDSFAYVADSDEANFDRLIATNLKSVWACMKYQVAQMLRQGEGAIVNTASVAGVAGVPGNTAYCAAKHGVVGLTRAAALEYADRGIRINAICPGLTRTGIVDRLTAAMPDAVGAVMPPMKRMAEPEEIAEFVVFMCSDRASFLAGQPIVVDGGWTAM